MDAEVEGNKARSHKTNIIRGHVADIRRPRAGGR
jgi:hypothetical protein